MEDIFSKYPTNLQKTIHLIRHGQTDFNLNNIIQGSGVDSNLNKNGIEQAQKFYDYYQNEEYQHIYTSQLKRAIQSVQCFIDKPIKHSALEELNEINWGIMEGMPSSIERHKEYERIISHWTNGNLHICIKDGETPLQLFERQKAGLDKIMQKTEEKKILLCMHGRAMRSFLCLLTQTPLKEMEKWQHQNLCLYVLEFRNNKFEIIESNSTKHLL